MAPTPASWWHPRIWAVALGLWLLPLAAQLMLSGMDWGAGDFLAWGVLILAGCAGAQLIGRLSAERRHRFLAGGGLLVLLLLVWVELAVGIVGPG